MKKILLPIAPNMEDPTKYKGVGRYYFYLYQSLSKLGHNVKIHCESQSIHKYLRKISYITNETISFESYSAEFRPDIIFIWGGRNKEDVENINWINKNLPDTKLIFCENGWFPQKDYLYFDTMGTNAASSLNIEDNDNFTFNIKDFNKVRKGIIRKDLGLSIFHSIPDFHIQKPGKKLKILVPLQDEKDSNIQISSPFKKMRQFIEFLSNNYPQYHFNVRPHPTILKYDLPDLNNVSYQSRSVALFDAIYDSNLIIGINSTLLLQAALHNRSVISIGDGLASYGGVTYKLDVNNPPDNFEDINVSTSQAKHRLYAIMKRQLKKTKISNPSYIKKSYLYDFLHD